MSMMNDNYDIKEMYDYQLEDLTKETYQKYLKCLKVYYEKEHKKDKYKKEFINNKLILIDKNDSKKKIEIVPSQFININVLYIELKELIDEILFKINNLIETKSNITEENRNEFELLKKKYMDCKKKIDNIDEINKKYNDEMQNLINDKIEKSTELAKYYQKRNDNYNDIKVHIKETLKNKLIKYFKENKNRIPPLPIINKIGKDNGIPSAEIEKWFNWIENVYNYLIIQKEINNIDKIIQEKENNFAQMTGYMIIKKPVLKI